MPSIDELNERFAIEDVARFEPGGGGLPRLVMTGPAAEAHVYLHGAHVSHYQPAAKPPVLFTSARSNYQRGKPIRGGVPVIFPWFGPRQDDPNAPMHGLVRTRQWDLESVKQTPSDRVVAHLAFASDDQTRALWPHDFALGLTVTLSPSSLRLELRVTNTSSAPFTFEEALHTYFAVQEIRQTTISGLRGAQYLDKNLGLSRHTQADELLQLTGAIDRVYLDTRSPNTIEDRAAGRPVWVLKENAASTVIWNPWSDKIGAMSDLDPQEWPRFVCVETCNVKENAVTLAPAQQHLMAAEITSDGPNL